MRLNDYRFRDTWLVGAPVRPVFATLVDLGAYPEWWPDVRSVRQVDEQTAELVCRARLPYALTITMTRAEENEREGRLRVDLRGDLVGSLGCLLSTQDGATRLDITQHVVAAKPLLRRLSPVAAPVFRANHALMMRRGRRGLVRRVGAPPKS
ncbi:SRPBCC family protein [Amycolatopsis sp. 195334CR]|uniref:SRPBCC family protein n=1 Tax=Amycolatopsis sp. 195334CR TaxID=2814588 RepID=UPI001A90CC20|nr:SRPBCC family protein [Amycolatopsis sp. 195334CR]MBN6038630.1 polyketide cyclase [Amycolatopsis sp. 195334CR]